MVRSMLAAVVLVLLVPGQSTSSPLLKPCDVQSIAVRCGTFAVPENRAVRDGRKISLRIVVVPARQKPAARDAFVYLAGGPGGAATELTGVLASMFSAVNQHHDLLLVDQRGTGSSNAFLFSKPHDLMAFWGDSTRYGTRTAMDDLEAVRAALGYHQLDLYGISYGATAAQVFLKRHPASVKTMTLHGGSELNVPFYGRFAHNAQRALGQIGKLCSADPSCSRAFPKWQKQFGELVRRWDAKPVENRKGERITGVGLAGVVHEMLLDVSRSVAIPLVVSRAAKGDYGPLNHQLESGESNGNGSGSHELLMYWSIWCNEPWVGLATKGPWGTDFDSYTRYSIDQKRSFCAGVPKRAEPRSAWIGPHGRTPVLAIAGGADPQDPVSNLPSLSQRFPDSRKVVVPHYGHSFSSTGCIDQVVATFISRGTTKRLDTSCVETMLPPLFQTR